MTSLVGALVEAWKELRVHRLRVLLSLVGVAIAVTAMTSVTAIGQIAQQGQAELIERQSGRPATLGVNAWSEGMGVPQGDGQATTDAMREVVDRYRIEHASLTSMTTTNFRFPAGTMMVQTQVVDPAYGAMRRIQVVHGTWFTAADEDRFAPAVVVNEAFLRELGVADLSEPVTATITGDPDVTTTIIGVVPDQWDGAMPEAFLLHAAFDRWGMSDPMMTGPPTLEVWIGPEVADIAQETITRDLQAMLGASTHVEAYRMDAFGYEAFDQAFQLIVTGIGVLVLLLGALSLVNIALVTVRQRIREIGIRRSFGATSARVFFSIMMESVVATFIAGVIGVAMAIAIVQNMPLDDWLGWGGVQDAPPFPMEAAMTGLVAATAVGALAGLLPALVAVRVKPIDAIRY